MGAQAMSQSPPPSVLMMLPEPVGFAVAFTPKDVHCWTASSTAEPTWGPWLVA